MTTSDMSFLTSGCVKLGLMSSTSGIQSKPVIELSIIMGQACPEGDIAHPSTEKVKNAQISGNVSPFCRNPRRYLE